VTQADLSFVMAGLVPAIHVFSCAVKQDVDARDKRGHDAERSSPNNWKSSSHLLNQCGFGSEVRRLDSR